MDGFEFGSDLQELHSKIAAQFEQYKEELSSQEHPNINRLLYKLNVDSDILLYKVKYETEKYLKDYLKDKENVSAINDASSIKAKKTECLIKLQTLTSMLTCHIINDYNTKMEKKEQPSKRQQN
ncbi:hypothetical protein BDFB_007195 [Asbolus verrucosus]|uniref:Uncharacterized protein n=1 Tax=Asbolus verrucosus TaxID=1661398 RepID=A0A482VG04_ASBVE|nr:hypothetical protein BDFB_007195 [Asbolus verrucosus]